MAHGDLHDNSVARNLSDLSNSLRESKNSTRDKFKELSDRITALEGLVNDILERLRNIKVLDIRNGDNVIITDTNGILTINAFKQEVKIPDIIDNLTTIDNKSVLSASQGQILKTLIDTNYQVIEKLSEEIIQIKQSISS